MPVISDLSLTITPSAALYTAPVSDSAISVSEDTTQGRHGIILDFNGSGGLYVRDLGTIFQWPTTARVALNIWQPSIIPLDEDVYYRLSFHFLKKSLGGVGWQHARELNIAFSSVADLSVLLSFDTTAVPTSVSFTVPNSGGKHTKQKVTLPPNKFKLIEGFISSPQPFLFWSDDMELKLRSWGSNEAYRIAKPFSG
jgi:hypothetical protein